MKTRQGIKANSELIFFKIRNESKLFHPTPPKLRKLAESEVPDASEWTIEEVVDFFRSLGFQQQADAFREQVTWQEFLFKQKTAKFSTMDKKNLIHQVCRIYIRVVLQLL